MSTSLRSPGTIPDLIILCLNNNLQSFKSALSGIKQEKENNSAKLR